MRAFAPARPARQVSPTVSPRLAVSRPGDRFEQEADRLAERVLATPAPNRAAGGERLSAVGHPVLQRACAACRDDETTLHRKAEPAAPTTSAALPASVHQVLGSPGQSLDRETLAFMQPRFGHDFSKVRVHSDEQAAGSARAVHARAYTVGQHIVFARGTHAPHTAEGRRLIAHELAHVVQQDRSGAPMLSRWSVDNCTWWQRETVAEGMSAAYENLLHGQRSLRQSPLSGRVRTALWLAFHDASDATAALARSRTDRLFEQLRATRYRCGDRETDATCGSDHGAPFAYADAGQVTLCRPAFFENRRTLAAVADTLIHESAHLVLGLPDRGYFTETCAETPNALGLAPGEQYSGTEGDSPAIRLDNADAVACFYHFLHRLPDAELRTRIAGSRGDDLAFDFDGVFAELYTRVSSPQSQPIRMRGAPLASGFRYRWTLIAGSAIHNLTSTRTNRPASEFSAANREVYVPGSVLEQLERSPLTEVTIRCEVEIAAASASGGSSPPIVQRELGFRLRRESPPELF